MLEENNVKLTKNLDIFTLEELSELLELNEQTLRRYVKAGRLKASKLRKLYFTKENVLEFMKDNAYNPETDDSNEWEIKQFFNKGIAKNRSVKCWWFIRVRP